MALNTRQHALAIRTVLLDRVVLVIERHLAVLVRLAILAQDHLFRLCLTLLFLDRNHADATERQNQDQQYFHESHFSHKEAQKNTKFPTGLLGHAEGRARVAAFAVFEGEVAAEGALAVVTGETARGARRREVFCRVRRAYLACLRGAGG